VSWLAFASSLRLGVCLADDMGLARPSRCWASCFCTSGARAEANRRTCWCPGVAARQLAGGDRALRTVVDGAGGSSLRHARPRDRRSGQCRSRRTDLVITTYGTLARVEALRAREWSLAILDEAQAIKNPGARQTQAVKALKARARIALTGTPVENRLGDLWSIYDFLDPGLLGSAREFSAFARRLRASRRDLRAAASPDPAYLLRRLKTDRSVIADLPDKTE